jgi:hypothetical protein
MKQIIPILLIVMLLIPIATFSQNCNTTTIPDQVTALREVIKSLQTQKLIKIGAFTYGKVLYKFNYALAKITNICSRETVDKNVLKTELQSILNLLDNLDVTHKVKFNSCEGEKHYVRSMWTLSKIINTL